MDIDVFDETHVYGKFLNSRDVTFKETECCLDFNHTDILCSNG